MVTCVSIVANYLRPHWGLWSTEHSYLVLWLVFTVKWFYSYFLVEITKWLWKCILLLWFISWDIFCWSFEIWENFVCSAGFSQFCLSWIWFDFFGKKIRIYTVSVVLINKENELKSYIFYSGNMNCFYFSESRDFDNFFQLYFSILIIDKKMP